MGTTQWELFRGYDLDDATTILEKTANHGFTFVQGMLLGVGDGNRPNAYGERPLLDGDALTPNEAYFAHVDAVVRTARKNGLAISMTIYHQRYREQIPREKARAWARWLARRYKDSDNIVWSTTPVATHEYVPILRELAAGLREGDGGRYLITFKPEPAPAPSSSFIHNDQESNPRCASGPGHQTDPAWMSGRGRGRYGLSEEPAEEGRSCRNLPEPLPRVFPQVH